MYNICEHLQNDGIRCPHRAMYRRPFCFHHWRLHEHPVAASQPSYDFPEIHDENALRLALSQVMRGIYSGKLDPRQAQSLLDGLRLSAESLRRPSLPTTAANAVILNEDERPSEGPRYRSAHPQRLNLPNHEWDLRR